MPMTEPGLSDRTTRAFCVGQAKSGTASLCGLLGSQHRAAHEPERENTLEMILRESRGDLDAESFRVYLQQRDERLNLEYDIAWANQFIIGHLLTVFPDARFVVLIRDPYTCLRSMVGHLISRQIPPDVGSFLDWWFRPAEHPHTSHDRVLERRGVYSTAAFLTAWNRHITRCAQLIPPSRRLILRTHELQHSHQRIAEFLQIPPESFDVRNGHLNQSTWPGQIDSLVDPTYLGDVVWSVCGDTMVRYFPEVSGIEDAYRLWDDPGHEHEPRTT